MLPAKRRVKKTLFPNIVKNGAYFHSPNLYLRVWDGKNILPSLFSFIIPAKVIKTAVGRHKSKRQVSAIIEGILDKIKPGYQCLFFVKKNILPLPYAQIEKEVIDLLQNAKLLN